MGKRKVDVPLDDDFQEEKKPQTKILHLTNCKQCPHCKTKLTKGFGYALDFYCSAADDKVIVGYVEWESEEPQDHQFPKFCPLKTAR